MADDTSTRVEMRAATREERDMDKRGRIRLSTMEIVLIGALLGSLVLGLLQARRDEHLLRELEAEGHH